MRQLFTVAIVAAVLVAPVVAQDPDAARERVLALEQEYKDAQAAWMRDYRAADAEARKELIAERPSAATWVAKFKTLADELEGQPAAAACWTWVVSNSRGLEQGQALAVLREHHLQDEALADACRALGGRVPSHDAELFLRAVLEKSPHNEVRGLACFALADTFMGMARTARALAGADDELLARYGEFYGKEAVAILSSADASEFDLSAEKFFSRTAEEYGDVAGRRGTLRKAAEAKLFELRNLAIGKVVPDIEGEDIDGVAFKLSDYRGKVVMLDFWGDW